MTKSDGYIHEHEVRKLILRLIDFFGTTAIERSILNYNKSLSSAGPVYREYYLRSRHPWLESLKYFFELEHSGRSIRQNLNNELKRLAGEGKKISILQQNMPGKVRNKYKKDLLDENRAYDYLFELQIAWHYHLQGYEIFWHEDDGFPEFLVRTPKFDFNVECKRISVDGSRRIRRRDFYRLVEILLPQIEQQHLKGALDIELDDRLHSSNQYLEKLSTGIIDIVNHENVGTFSFPFGKLTLNLIKNDGEVVDFRKQYKNLLGKKSHKAHAAIFAKGENGNPVDPIELTIKSRKADNVLDGMKRKIQKAATKQLPKSTPGLIACFLEGISDLNELESGSGLQLMSCYILDKPENSHIAAISYCSEGRIFRYKDIEDFNFQGLLFRNPNCSFTEVDGFAFLSKEIEG